MREKMKVIIAALSIIIIVLLVISIVSPWYNMSFSMKGNAINTVSNVSTDIYGRAEIDFYLEDGEVKLEASSTSNTGELLRQEQTQKAEYTGFFDRAITSFNTVLFLIIVSILMFLVFLVFVFKKIRRKTKIVIFSFLTLLLFVTLIYSSVEIPSKLDNSLDTYSNKLDASDSISNRDFYAYELFNRYDGGLVGSYSYSKPWTNLSSEVFTNFQGTADIGLNWGPSSGWYLLLISAILSLFNLGIVVLKKDVKIYEQKS